jgi:hypothetical protein
VSAIEKQLLGDAVFLLLRVLLVLCTRSNVTATVIDSLLREARNWHDEWYEAVLPTR